MIDNDDDDDGAADMYAASLYPQDRGSVITATGCVLSDLQCEVVMMVMIDDD